MRFFTRFSGYWGLLLVVAGTLSGCVQTFTFAPEKTASVFGENNNDTFGVCFPFFLDRRGTRLYLWDEFVRQLEHPIPDRRVSNLAGYEVAVTRGESCHLRMAETFQAAVRFDLSTLPEGAAVTSAELRVSHRLVPVDAPWLHGTQEQCTVVLIGRATESWDSGIYRYGSPDGPRSLIAFAAVRPYAGHQDARGGRTINVDVTHTVSEWVRGVRANEGFVITPDRERVMAFYNATDQGGYFCDIGVNEFELVITAAVPG